MLLVKFFLLIEIGLKIDIEKSRPLTPVDSDYEEKIRCLAETSKFVSQERSKIFALRNYLEVFSFFDQFLDFSYSIPPESDFRSYNF